LIDILERHQIERKRTSEFLKYALSNRSKTPGEAPRKLLLKTKLPSLKQASVSELEAGDTIFSSGISKRQNSKGGVKLPRLMNNKSLND
jgi:hypothetical protein